MYFEIMIQQFANVPTAGKRSEKIGYTKRWTFSRKDEAMVLINDYNGVANTLSISVNPYLEVDRNNRVNYETVFIKKMFFDLDTPHMKDVTKLCDYFIKNNIKFHVRFSGKGFHVLPYCFGLERNIDGGMMAVQDDLAKELGVVFCKDAKEYCRVDRVSRIVDTYNRRRQRYCIALEYKDLFKSYDEIKEMAKVQRFIDPVIGEELWDLRPYNDYQGYRKSVCELPQDLNSTLQVIGLEKQLNEVGLVTNDICPMARFLLSKGELGYKERYFLIIYFKTVIGFDYEMIANMLKNNIATDRFNHSYYFEKQNYYIFCHTYKHNCDKCRQFGLCREDCDRSWINV